MGLSTITSTLFHGLGNLEPGGMKFLDPMIVMGTIGIIGNLAARRATPVLPFCKNGGLGFLDRVPSGKIPKQPPELSTSTALANASLPPVSLKVSIWPVLILTKRWGCRWKWASLAVVYGPLGCYDLDEGIEVG